MALQKSLELTNGLVCIDAYHKIDNVSITKSKEQIFISVCVKSYANKTARDENKETINNKSYQIALPTTLNEETGLGVTQTLIEFDLTKENNIFQIAYTAIKLLPQFENASDV